MMGKIIVYNSNNESHENEKNNFYIGRSKDGNPLGNPFTYDGKKSVNHYYVTGIFLQRKCRENY